MPIRTAPFILLLLVLLSLPQGANRLHAEEPLPPLPELQDSLPPLPPLEGLPPLPELEQQSEAAKTVWTCSMHPNIQLPEFGQCPICFMDLIEVTLDSGAELTGLRQISLSESARRLARVEVTPVRRGTAAATVRMVGKVDYDETRVKTLTAWINGRIDKLHIAYTGSQVRTGQPVAEMYSPELLTAQAELIEAVAAAARIKGSENPLLENTIERTELAARKKLQLLGLTDGQINGLVSRAEPSDHVTLTAPISGIVIKKEVTEGMYVKTGAPIYTIADLSKLWVVLEAYESDLGSITLGQRVEFSTEAFPGSKFNGEVVYIDPLVNEKTRTVRVRLNVDNTDQLLKPGMFVRAMASTRIADRFAAPPLLVPASAPLFTGKRAIVYVQLQDREGVYEGREVALGSRRGDFYEVASGLEEGDLVVSRGNFKIDSAIQIQARPSMMNPFTVKEATEPSDLPPLFFSKLTLLNEAFLRLSEAVHASDQKAQDTSLRTFARLLDGIQGDTLSAMDRLDWKELAMLLASDVILLGEAETAPERDRIYAEMATHFHQVRTRFKLTETVAAKQGSEELRQRLGDLLNRYLSLQKNLADDAEEQALADIPHISKAVNDLTTELKTSGQEKAAEIAAELNTATQLLAASTTIGETRAAFYPLSRGIIQAVSAFGVSGAYPVYEHYCPMAFNDTGANWLDTSEVISNPYFGDEMLRCGEVQRQLKIEE